MPTKDPTAVLDYGIDWAAAPPKGPWLINGDTIVTSTWIVDAGLTQDRPATFNATTTTVWLAGGTVGQRYKVTNRITTTGGRTEERTLTFDISDR